MLSCFRPPPTAGDGNVDVVTANSGQDSQVFWGDGSGNVFTESAATLNSVIDRRTVTTSNGDAKIDAGNLKGHKTLELFDYDGDGVLDVLLGFAVLKSNGDRTFTDDPLQSFSAPKCVLGTNDYPCTEPNGISIGDYDADGDLVRTRRSNLRHA